MELLLTQSALQSGGGLMGPVAGIMALIAFGIIFLCVLRPYFFPKNKNSDNALNTDLLERKGVMTKEEMRSVRNAMVRQTLKEQELEQQKPSIEDFGSIIAQAESGRLGKKEASPVAKIPPVETVPDAEIPEAAKNKSSVKPVTRLVDIQLSSERSSTQVPTADQSDGESSQAQSGSVDIKTLLEKGLITQAEYEKIGGRFSEENKDAQR